MDESGTVVTSLTIGQTYTATLNGVKSSEQWAMEATGASFTAGGCSAKNRIFQGSGDSTFVVSSNSGTISLIAGAASKYGQIYISPVLTLQSRTSTAPAGIAQMDDDAYEKLYNAYTADDASLFPSVDDANLRGNTNAYTTQYSSATDDSSTADCVCE